MESLLNLAIADIKKARGEIDQISPETRKEVNIRAALLNLDTALEAIATFLLDKEKQHKI